MTQIPPVNITFGDGSLSGQEVSWIRDTGLPPSDVLGGGLKKWLEEQEWALEARTGKGGNPLNGWGLPGADLGSFLQMISQVETYMQAVGFDYKYMPTPFLMQYAVQAGLNHNQNTLFSFFAQQTGADKVMPGAAFGMPDDQYHKQVETLNSAVYNLTGKNSWAEAGLDGAAFGTAIANGWDSTKLGDFIKRDPNLSQQYAYLKHGYNYETFQTWKSQNKSQATAKYGHNISDQNYIELMSNPTTPFTTSGGPVSFDQSKQAGSGHQGFVR